MKNLSEKELQEVAASELTLACKYLSRRSMIRNHFFFLWAKSVMMDELVKYYVAPVVSFFLIRNLPKTK
jgi:hypothetical protein